LVQQLRHRSLAGAGAFTFVAADALMVKVRGGGRVTNMLALVATRVHADGRRDVLASPLRPARPGHDSRDTFEFSRSTLAVVRA
jgi:transposase-like protein